MKKIFFILISFSILSSYAQHDKNNANIWYFGNKAGIDFNFGNPIAKTDGQLITQEGVATVCKHNGDLLFYTDGRTVWDKNHTPMPNGNNSLNGHYSSTQSAIIVPNFADTTEYYIFTTDELAGSNGLSYSIVDISLSGNGSSSNPMGDILPNYKNIQLISPVTEKLTAVLKPNLIEYWVIAHGWNNNFFYAYEVTINGINPNPIVTSIGNIHTGGSNNINSVGYMKASPEGNKLALVNRNINSIDIYDFNHTTGVVSNEVSINMGTSLLYGLEYSANNNYLYIGGRAELFRYNFTTSILENVAIDDLSIFNNTNASIRALQIGPNGKIYVSVRESKYLSVISEPDSINAILTINGINLDTDNQNRYAQFGLPNLFFYKGWLNPDYTSNVNNNNEIQIITDLQNDIITIKSEYVVNTEIYNVAGNIILSTIAKKIDIGSFSSGTYILRCSTSKNKSLKITKFIKL